MDLHARRRGFATAAVLAALALIASACGASPRVTREVEARDRNGLATGVQASASGAEGGGLAAADGAGAAAGPAGGAGSSAASGGGPTAAAGRRAGAAGGAGAGTASQAAAGACGAAA